MAGKQKKPWYLFSFLDLEIFNTPEVQTSSTTSEGTEETTSQPSESITNDTSEKLADSLGHLCINTPQTQPSGAINDGEDEHISQPLQSKIDDNSNRPFRFLDLPAELRDQIYNLLIPAPCKSQERTALFTPPFFDEWCIPQSISLNIKIRSCREDAYDGTRCENVNCGENAVGFRKVTRINRQIRDEVNRILYARSNLFKGTYQFKTAAPYSHRKYDDSDIKYDIGTPLCKLAKFERNVVWRLEDHGIPFAVLKTRSAYTTMYELLVPDWAGEFVSWRKLSDVEWTFLDDEPGDEALHYVRERAKQVFADCGM